MKRYDLELDASTRSPVPPQSISRRRAGDMPHWWQRRRVGRMFSSCAY